MKNLDLAEVYSPFYNYYAVCMTRHLNKELCPINTDKIKF